MPHLFDGRAVPESLWHIFIPHDRVLILAASSRTVRTTLLRLHANGESGFKITVRVKSPSAAVQRAAQDQGITSMHMFRDKLIVYSSLVNISALSVHGFGQNFEVQNQAALGVDVLAAHLEQLPHLVALDISNNQIGHRGVHTITSALRSSSLASGLTSLNLSKTGLSSFGASTFTSLCTPIMMDLRELSLTSLNLNGNGISKTAGQELRHLNRLTSLRILDLSDNNLSHRTNTVPKGDVIELSAMLYNERNKTGYIETLNLDRNNLDPVGLVTFYRNLPLFTTLTDLSLEQNKLAHYTIKRLAAALEKSPHVKTLNLSANPITHDTMEIFSERLMRSGVSTLVYRRASISDQSAKVLFDNLRHGNLLEILDLQDNDIKDGKVIVDGLHPDKGLRSLNLRGNPVRRSDRAVQSWMCGENGRRIERALCQLLIDN